MKIEINNFGIIKNANISISPLNIFILNVQEYLACATSLGSVICYIPKVYVSAVL